jgi:hypothetical protein
MFADEKQKRLLFMMGKGLWAFYPENEEFKPLFSFSYPGSRPFSWAQKIGGKIYASVWLSNRFYFVCDMKTDNVECVLSDGNKRNNKLLKTPPLNTAELHVFSPFFYQNGQFWFGAHKVAFINSNDISNILSVKGLDFYSCTLFFPCGNGGSVIAATPFSFYKIIPPPLLDR